MAAAPSADLWDGGWHREAVRLPSPNHGPRPVDARQSVDLVVVHSISLPPGQYGTGAVQQLFTNALDWEAHPYFQQIRGLQVSAHFFIERSGRLWQFVDCDQRAWHAGQSAYRGRTNCNDDSIGVELEGLEGHLFEPAQYLTLAALCHALAARYPLRYLAGHEHVASGRKQDPGPGFDWRTLATLLAPNTLELPSQVTPL